MKFFPFSSRKEVHPNVHSWDYSPTKGSPSEYVHGEDSSPTKWSASWSASFMLICVLQSCRHHKATWCLAGSIVTIPLQCSIKLPWWWVDVNVCPYIHINSPYTMFPLYCNCEATGQHMIGFMPGNVWCSNGSNFLMPLVFGFHPEWILHTAKSPLFKLSPNSYLLVTHVTSDGPEWTSTHQCTTKDGFCKW